MLSFTHSSIHSFIHSPICYGSNTQWRSSYHVLGIGLPQWTKCSPAPLEPRGWGNLHGDHACRYKAARGVDTRRNTQASPCFGCRAWAGSPRTGLQGGGPRGTGAWPAGPCPLMSTLLPRLNCRLWASPSPNRLQPRPLPGGQLCLSVLANCPCVTGQVSDQALLFCPRTIQGTARPRRLDGRVAKRHCPELPRG